MVCINGQTIVFIKEIGMTIKFQDMENILGMMAEPMLGIGKKTICMVKEFINGLMVECMKANI